MKQRIDEHAPHSLVVPDVDDDVPDLFQIVLVNEVTIILLMEHLCGCNPRKYLQRRGARTDQLPSSTCAPIAIPIAYGRSISPGEYEDTGAP